MVGWAFIDFQQLIRCKEECDEDRRFYLSFIQNIKSQLFFREPECYTCVYI